MERVNELAVKNISGDSVSSLKKHRNSGAKVVTAIGLATALTVMSATPALAHSGGYSHNQTQYYNNNYNQGYKDYSNYDIIKYNSNWGVQYADHTLDVNVNRNNVGVVRINEAPTDLRRAMDNCIGAKELNETRYHWVTFDVAPNRNNNNYWIDLNSFAIYRGNISSLGTLNIRTVVLRARVFISPEGQTWVDEKNYVDYINGQNVLFECSDGILVNSYQSFKDWESELARRANNEQTITDNPNQNVNLSSIRHINYSVDGTIWRNQTLLDEYIQWCSNHNYNYRDGVYYGTYGNFVSFEDYMKYYNVGYFVEKGLKISQQHYGAYGLLYGSAELAKDSLKQIDGYQKRK